MKNNKNFLTGLAIFLILGASAAASHAQTAALYLKMDTTARAAAMGGAFTGMMDDGSAPLYNPASITAAKTPTFSTSTANLGNGIRHTYFNAAYPLSSNHSASFSWIRLTSGSVSILTPTGLSTIEDKQDAYILSYGVGLRDNIKIGANIKFLKQDFGISSAKGNSFDIGALYTLPQGAALGLNLQDIGGSLKDDKSGAKSDMDFIIKLGGSYKFMQDKLLAALAFDFGVDSGDKKTLTHFGLEYYPLPETKMLALRAGYDDKFFTTGIGVNFRGLGVDYSYRNKNDVGDSIQRVSVMYQLMKY